MFFLKKDYELRSCFRRLTPTLRNVKFCSDFSSSRMRITRLTVTWVRTTYSKLCLIEALENRNDCGGTFCFPFSVGNNKRRSPYSKYSDDNFTRTHVAHNNCQPRVLSSLLPCDMLLDRKQLNKTFCRISVFWAVGLWNFGNEFEGDALSKHTFQLSCGISDEETLPCSK